MSRPLVTQIPKRLNDEVAQDEVLDTEGDPLMLSELPYLVASDPRQIRINRNMSTHKRVDRQKLVRHDTLLRKNHIISHSRLV